MDERFPTWGPAIASSPHAVSMFGARDRERAEPWARAQAQRGATGSSKERHRGTTRRRRARLQPHACAGEGNHGGAACPPRVAMNGGAPLPSLVVAKLKENRGGEPAETCSDGTITSSAAPPRATHPGLHSAARERWKGKDGMWLRVLGEWPVAGFDRAKCTESHPMASNGQRRPDRIQPRRGGEFPAQAQVAAWARGSERARRVMGRGPRHRAVRCSCAARCWAARLGRREDVGPRGSGRGPLRELGLRAK
jgi:hypothetical protein